MVDEPQGSHYGGEVAGPIFDKVMSAALPYLGVAPQGAAQGDRFAAAGPERSEPEAKAPPAAPVVSGHEDDAEEVSGDEGGEGPDGSDVQAGAGNGQVLLRGTVPDFRGLGLGDALALAQKADLRLEISGSGRVVSQVPPQGAALKGPVCHVRLAPPQ